MKYLEIMQDVKYKNVKWEDVDKECLKNLIEILEENKDYFSDLMQTYGIRLELKLYKPNTEITKYIYTLSNANEKDIEHIVKNLKEVLNNEKKR